VEEEHLRGPSAEQSGWVTTRVAAQALRVDPRTVRKYINQGKLEAKVEGEGVEKTYLVSIDSVYALRGRQPSPRPTRDREQERAAGSEDIAGVVRDLAALISQHSAEAAQLRTRLELTEQAESTLRAERDQLQQDLERERELRREAQQESMHLAADLEAERSKGFWRRLFGG
jgi:hypothetical protein